MNNTTMTNNTTSVIEVINSAVIAVEKLQKENYNAYKTGKISYECHSNLDTFFSIRFLKAIRDGYITFESFFDEECRSIDIACEIYYDQIKSNLTLMNALINYVNALNRLKELYFGDLQYYQNGKK